MVEEECQCPWCSEVLTEIVLEREIRVKLVRNYFICVDKKDLEKDGILLAKVVWDGDRSGREGTVKQKHLVDGVEVWHVPVKEVYQTLHDVWKEISNRREKR